MTTGHDEKAASTPVTGQLVAKLTRVPYPPPWQFSVRPAKLYLLKCEERHRTPVTSLGHDLTRFNSAPAQCADNSAPRPHGPGARLRWRRDRPACGRPATPDDNRALKV